MKTLLLSFLLVVSTSHTFNRSQQKEDYVPGIYTFGVFCGECLSNCAVMWRYNNMGRYSTLWMDQTDSYFKYGDELEFATNVSTWRKMTLADQIVSLIPQSLLESTETEQTFGCPDCSDGCGIYLQIQTNSVTRTFEIGYVTADLDAEMKAFVEAIKEPLRQLRVQ